MDNYNFLSDFQEFMNVFNMFSVLVMLPSRPVQNGICILFMCSCKKLTEVDFQAELTFYPDISYIILLF
jgi:hypothetical protein